MRDFIAFWFSVPLRVIADGKTGPRLLPRDASGKLLPYVDDVRPCPEGWALARTYDNAMNLLRRFEYDVE